MNFADGVFSSPKTNRTMTIKEVAIDAANPAKIPAAMEPGLLATAVYKAPVSNFPNGCHVCEVEIDKETGECRRSCATAWSTTSAPCSIRCCCTARSMAASRRAPARC